MEPNFVERALYLISPKAGEHAYQKRVKAEKEKSGVQDVKNAVSGYGRHGASGTLNSLIGWIVGGSDAEGDIDVHGSTLRKRARDLYAGGGLGRSGPATLTTNVVGWGIQPKPKIDGEALGLSEEECDAWERNTLREFQLWAENTMCDSERSKNFWELQQLAFRSHLMSGDCFVVFGMKQNKRTPYELVLRLLEADRVSSPDSAGDSTVAEVQNGVRIVDGVELTKDGEVTAYHISNRHPLSDSSTESLEWVRVAAYGKDTGYPNVLHITTFERPEQRRGIPFVAAQIEQIKQLDRYITSELAANIVAAMLAVFIESDSDDGKFGLEDAVNEDEKVTDDDFSLELAPGGVYQLPPGKKVKDINPIRNNSSFEAFVSACMTIIGAGMEIPKEVLIKKYESNYTAARGALLDFWQTVRVRRTAFNDQFNTPIYEQWLAEAVAKGRVDAPGFFDDPAIRRAWCGCMWMGTSMGHVDPLKEAKAAAERVNLNMTTEEQEAASYNGNDWNENVRQRKKEIQARAEIAKMTQKQEDTANE